MRKGEKEEEEEEEEIFCQPFCIGPEALYFLCFTFTNISTTTNNILNLQAVYDFNL